MEYLLRTEITSNCFPILNPHQVSIENVFNIRRKIQTHADTDCCSFAAAARVAAAVATE